MRQVALDGPPATGADIVARVQLSLAALSKSVSSQIQATTAALVDLVRASTMPPPSAAALRALCSSSPCFDGDLLSFQTGGFLFSLRGTDIVVDSGNELECCLGEAAQFFVKLAPAGLGHLVGQRFSASKLAQEGGGVAVLTADLSLLKDRGSAVLDVALATRPEPLAAPGTVVTLMPGARCLIGEALLGPSYTLSRSELGGRLEVVSAAGTSHVLDLLPAKQPRRLGRLMDHLPPHDVAIRLDAPVAGVVELQEMQADGPPSAPPSLQRGMPSACSLALCLGPESPKASDFSVSDFIDKFWLLRQDEPLVAASVVQGQMGFASFEQEVASYMQSAVDSVVAADGVVEDYVESEAEEEGPPARPPPAPHL